MCVCLKYIALVWHINNSDVLPPRVTVVLGSNSVLLFPLHAMNPNGQSISPLWVIVSLASVPI